ncbi:hypothetical protein A1O7_01804 [Cladophialophora yegresii CBS 114405]|uniref:Major facilitator superfamily (MFS) profile domain-containing protein n=1 Tax=Cladophialophora yegresii CBS 114405 TaxID=1182544 RepID=W9WC00_9EURO|nr:uncharacterized protein A1O7_01804 [Cladophialophora yegresii CBS 114405]EXJ65463.1 hypothetical protein A1O7_01804 [Cladophialophora yegresii CBS 114405]
MAPDIILKDSAILGDKAVAAHEEQMHAATLTPAEKGIEKKLRLKIDLLIMPMVILVYLMNYIDRNNYAAARLQGLEEDLNLTGDEYQVGLSILFVAYVLMQVPSNLLLNYSGRPSLYLGGCTVAWGLISAVTSQVQSYGGIVACRFVLGLVEAPFFAGVVFYLSKWYTKEELSLRMSIFYCGSLISGARGMSAWQWLYILEGSITVLLGLIVCVALPDFPGTWKGLSPEMQRVANRRLAIDAAEIDVDEAGAMSQLYGMKLAFLDPKTYILAVAYHAINGAAGFQNFFPTLTATLGYSHTVSLLLVAPPYIFIVVWSLGHSYLSDRLANRFWFFVYPVPLTIVGFVIFMTTDSFGPRYFSFFLMNMIFAMVGTCYAWISSAIPRPPAKRAATLAFINSFGSAAGTWTPFTYYKSQGNHYPVALGICIAMQVLAGICGLLLRLILARDNRRLARLENEDVQLNERELARLHKTAEVEGIDLAAARRLQKGYRYML